MGEEFEISYRFSTYSIVSGSVAIQYDPELFAVVSATPGGFLADKIADVNTQMNGAVYISFVGTKQQYKYDLITVRFITLKNVSESSEIKLTVSELCDLDLNLYTCKECTTKATVAFDETYTEDAPTMSVSATYLQDSGKVTATVRLEKDSMLGAGDFVLRFDAGVLTYVSAQKEFRPDFFLMNEASVSNGVLKFYLLSTENIVEEQTVLTVTFDVKSACVDQITDFIIEGSVLTDSLGKSVLLNFVGGSATVPLKYTASEAVEENKTEATCTANGSYDRVVYCAVCKAELSREAVTVPMLGHAFGDWAMHDVNQHKRVCACGEEAFADHVYDGEADASCNDCGATREIATAPPTVETQSGGITNAGTEKSGCGASVFGGLAWAILLLVGAGVSIKKKEQ